MVALLYFHFQFLRRANGDAGECATQIFLMGTKYVEVETFITFLYRLFDTVRTTFLSLWAYVVAYKQ